MSTTLLAIFICMNMPIMSSYRNAMRTMRVNFSKLSRRLPRMMNNENIFITTPIYYVNGMPHLGHAYTSVAADVIARFYRKDGKNVYFATGTDEHGQKVQQSANDASKSPQQFVDEVADVFKALAVKLNCSNDDFIRTTEIRHKKGVDEIWKRLLDRGEIYLGAYEGWYSVRDESFYAESELVGGKAPTGAEVQWVKEESYFFKLSSYTDKLLKFYNENPNFIGPEGRKNEVVSFVAQDGGLRDLSISRTTFTWGVPVPGDPKHVVYVWLDALTNYLTVLGFPDYKDSKYEKFWPASLHLVGKDILRFHAVFWPAFLMAAELPLPQRIFAHGWWTKDGEKMSKSVGNVLDPDALIAQYGLDYLRYFLVAEVPFGNDGDFSNEAFILRINSNLANELGNLAQRALVMINKNCESRIPDPVKLEDRDLELLKAAEDALDQVRNHVASQSLHKMCESVIAVARLGNKYIDTEAPWVLRKTDPARMRTVLYTLTETVRRMAILLDPVMPQSMSKLLDMMGASAEMRTFASIHEMIPPGTVIQTASPIFPRIERPVAASPAAK